MVEDVSHYRTKQQNLLILSIFTLLLAFLPVTFRFCWPFILNPNESIHFLFAQSILYLNLITPQLK